MYLEKEKENVPLLEFFEELKQKQKLAQKPDYPNLEIFLQRLSFSSSDFLTPEQMEKMSKETSILKFQKISWSFKEKKLLVWVVFHHMELTRRKFFEISKEDWKTIAKIVGKNAAECALKFEALKRSNVQHKAWTSQENLVLSDIVRKHNPENIKWKEVAMEFYEECSCPIVRNAKQCRAHWITHLRGIRKQKENSLLKPTQQSFAIPAPDLFNKPLLKGMPDETDENGIAPFTFSNVQKVNIVYNYIFPDASFCQNSMNLFEKAQYNPSTMNIPDYENEDDNK